MSAEVLREAAALMRERAEAATPGPWESLDRGDRLVAWRMTADGFDDDFEYVVDEPVSNASNAEHIASWHPAVALAVARWLDSAADHMDPELALDGGCPDCEQDGALAVARAYLGSDQ